MFELLTALRHCDNNQHSQILTDVSFAISRSYANLAIAEADTKIVTVSASSVIASASSVTTYNKQVQLYLSSDKDSEGVGLTVNNNLWCAELPTLKAASVEISVFLYSDGTWRGPVNLNDLDIPVWRRNWHPLDNDIHRSSFVEPHYNITDFDSWRLAPARPYISLSYLRALVARLVHKFRVRRYRDS